MCILTDRCDSTERLLNESDANRQEGDEAAQCRSTAPGSHLPSPREARPLAQGCPLGPRGAPSPSGCRRAAAAPLIQCPPKAGERLPPRPPPWAHLGGTRDGARVLESAHGQAQCDHRAAQGARLQGICMHIHVNAHARAHVNVHLHLHLHAHVRLQGLYVYICIHMLMHWQVAGCGTHDRWCSGC